jgi:hypothetical protein
VPLRAEKTECHLASRSMGPKRFGLADPIGPQGQTAQHPKRS